MRPLTVDSLARSVINVEYAVRGELAIKAEQYRVKLADPNYDGSLPFDRVISTNIGNPQQRGLDQPPITFTRQVSAPVASWTYRLWVADMCCCLMYVIGRCVD